MTDENFKKLVGHIQFGTPFVPNSLKKSKHVKSGEPAGHSIPPRQAM